MTTTISPGQTDRMSEFDALMWIVERNPMLRSTMTSVAIFDGQPDRKVVRERIDRMTRVIPRLRQRVRGNPFSIATPRWEIDPDFDLDYHLRWIGVGGDRTVRDVLDLTAPIVMQGFDRERPLWEADVVEGLADGTTALILKTHHSVVDGMGAMRMQMELFDFEPGIVDKGPMPDAPSEVVLGQAERSVDALAHELRAQREVFAAGRDFLKANLMHPLDTTRSVAEGVVSAGRLLKPIDAPLSPLLSERSLNLRLDTIELSLSELKAASKLAGGKLNDSFLAGLCLGLGEYHQRHGLPAEALRFGVPVNQRPKDGDDSAEGNHWAPVRFELAILDDPIEQMHEIQARMAATTAEPALAWLASISGAIRRLPKPMATAIVTASMRGTDVQASNVPGSPLPLYLAGVPMLAQFPFGPVTTSALNVTLLSYRDDLHIGVAMNDAAIDDPGQLVDDLRNGFRQVIDGKSRRTP